MLFPSPQSLLFLMDQYTRYLTPFVPNITFPYKDSQKKQPGKRNATLQQNGDILSSIILTTSIWAYKIMCDTTFMPEWLGGKGKDIYTQSRQYPSCPQATFEMNIFYMIQAGKHFSRFISHVFIRPEGSYFEYVLHHGLSVFLIVFSYLSNQWLVGIFVLLIHDFSDVGIHVVRVYRDYKHMNKLVKNIMQIPVFAIWIICRNFLLSYQCIYVGIVNFPILIQNISPLAYNTMALPLSFMIFMMICLELLQVYFTLQVIQFVIESNKPDKKKIKK